MKLINRNKKTKNVVDREGLILSFVDGASEAFFIFDSNLFTLEMNDVALALVGKERSQVVGADIKELLPNWAKNDRFQLFRDVIRTGDPVRFRDYIIDQEKGTRLYEVAAFKVKSGVGVLLYDVSARKLKSVSEISLEGNSEAIQKVIHESFIVLDSDNRVISANPVFYKHFTFKPEQVIGESIYDLGETQWDLPALHELLDYKLSRAIGINNYKVQGYFQGLGERILNINARLFNHESEDNVIILLAIEDVSKVTAQQESLKKLADIYMRAPDPIILTDLKGDIVELNDRAEELYGWSRSELLQKSFKTIMPRDVRDQYDHLLQTVIEEGAIQDLEAKHWTKKGQAIPIKMSVIVLQNSAEENIGTVTYVKHIPSHSRAERAVKRWQELYLSSSDAMIYFDFSGKIVDMNPAAEGTFNWPKSGLVGKEARVLIHEDYYKRFEQHLAALQGDKRVQEFDFNRLGPKGAVEQTRATLYQLPDGSNTPDGIAMVVKHISDEEKMTAAYRQIVKNFLATSDAVIVENPAGEITDMNTAAELLYGWSRKELLGKPAKSLAPVDQQKQAGEWVAQVMEGELIENAACRRWTKSGSVFSANLRMFQMTGMDGRPNGVITITKPTKGTVIEGKYGRIDMDFLYQQHADPIVIEDLRGNILDMNKAALKILGWGANELLKKPFKTILPTDQYKQLEKIRLLWEKKVPIHRAEIKIWSKTGQVYPMSLNMIECVDGNGQVVGIANIFQDITEYKKLQLQNQKLESQLRKF